MSDSSDTMTASDYGKKVGLALRAVQALHTDTSRLLRDCDGTIGKGRTSVFGNYATKDLTWHVDCSYWMPEAVYRLYDAIDVGPGIVEGVTAHFIELAGRSDEPLLIVGQLRYRVKDQAISKGVCQEWDLWNAFFEWTPTRTLGTVLVPQSPDGGRIEWVKLIAVPLYSITKMDDVTHLMEKVRTHVLPITSTDAST